ncbi:hypothetical protein JAB5_20380 [Janthinobacterium sp. HH103]|uniref:hypothetical protein n=1 Tax=unclassified Janthinobacterium TaxID=2610881 RepID=UPI0008745063|nr:MULTISPECIES: hypothetical protein [unclassified Janthinobacterium]OEZ73726.1 hypothetical protein JAB2_00190 [Janthinobacterium sp. HH100]OEZ80572.1 hypothetical protein JAB5_20380 [Janthinobacterium sp. HH103]QOU74149.1 hypothetical protein JAB4_036100 [Janthinobacterium sp. HH102]
MPPLTELSELTKDQSYAIADSLAQASSLVLELRIREREALAPDERALLEQYENHLDQMVALFRAYGIYLTAEGAEQARVDIEGAIAKGKSQLKRIADIKAAIGTAARLVDLGAAILSRDPFAIGEAAASLRAKPKKDAQA